MRRNSEDVNHHRHADVAGAAAEKSAEQSADERNEDDDPERNRFTPELGSEIIGQRCKRLDRLGQMPESEDSSFLSPFPALWLARLFCKRSVAKLPRS